MDTANIAAGVAADIAAGVAAIAQLGQVILLADLGEFVLFREVLSLSIKLVAQIISLINSARITSSVAYLPTTMLTQADDLPVLGRMRRPLAAAADYRC